MLWILWGMSSFDQKPLARNQRTMFPLNIREYGMKLRKPTKYKINKQNTKRLKKSALPYMRKLLKDENEKKEITMKNIQKLKV